MPELGDRELDLTPPEPPEPPKPPTGYRTTVGGSTAGYPMVDCGEISGGASTAATQPRIYIPTADQPRFYILKPDSEPLFYRMDRERFEQEYYNSCCPVCDALNDKRRRK